MTQSEAWLGRTAAQLAGMLTSDLDAADYLATVAERGAELVDGAHVGILLADAGGLLTAVAASPDRMRMVEVLELQNREGPGLECYRSGEQVVNAMLDERARVTWPTFAPRALKEGVRALHALPLRVPEVVLGVLVILDTQARELSGRAVGLAQTLADLATVGVIQQRYARRRAHIADQLRASIDERVVIDQAKGLVAQRLTVDVDTASELMRAYGRTAPLPLGDLARAIVRARFAPEDLRLPAAAKVRPGAA